MVQRGARRLERCLKRRVGGAVSSSLCRCYPHQENPHEMSPSQCQGEGKVACGNSRPFVRSWVVGMSGCRGVSPTRRCRRCGQGCSGDAWRRLPLRREVMLPSCPLVLPPPPGDNSLPGSVLVPSPLGILRRNHVTGPVQRKVGWGCHGRKRRAGHAAVDYSCDNTNWTCLPPKPCWPAAK
jgi:hypothetical protein